MKHTLTFLAAILVAAILTGCANTGPHLYVDRTGGAATVVGPGQYRLDSAGVLHKTDSAPAYAQGVVEYDSLANYLKH